MGDPVKPRKKFERPTIEWNADRIKEESALKNEYGLKNTREIWRARSELRRIRANARKLLAGGIGGEKKAKEILERVQRYGILKSKEDKINTLDDLLALDIRNILDRRLQTRVYKKGLARTIKQARQLIVHGYIAINGKRVTVPGYIVPLDEEDNIGYYKHIDIAPKIESRENIGTKKDVGEEDG